MIRGTLAITPDVKDGYVALILEGSIDSATSPKLRLVLRESFLQPNKGVIIETSGIHYMDSSALATMVEGLQLAEKEKKHFCLAGKITDKIIHLLEISRLEEIFPRYTSLEEALASMNNR